MPPTIARRLPGVVFDAEFHPSGIRLPRMDVAALVGFAARGPIGVPVPVESAARFEDVFGSDAELAFDPVGGQRGRAHLAPAVRAFFRGGGRRAWIVRVASGARTSEFPIPGLLIGPPGALGWATVPARCPGSWADGLRVGSTLASEAVHLLGVSADGWTITVRRRSGAPVSGDLLRIEQGDRVLLVVVGDVRVRPAAVDDPASESVLDVTLSPESAVWLERLLVSADASGAIRYVDRTGRQLTASALASPQAPVATEIGAADTGLTFEIEGSTALLPPAVGDFIRLPGFDPMGSGSAWLRVTYTTRAQSGHIVLRGRGWLTTSHVQQPGLPVGADAIIARLSLELRVTTGTGEIRTLAALGLAPGHPRYLGALPDDVTLFHPRPAPEPPLEVWSEVGDPRFPLAGRLGTSDDLSIPAEGQDAAFTPSRVYYPIDVDLLPGTCLGARGQQGSALGRDGLATFDAGMFLDPELADAGVATLSETADYVRWFGPKPRLLSGVHSALSIDEATLLAVPDAVHRGWHLDEGPSAPPAPPSEAPSSRAPHGFEDCGPRIPPAAPRLGDPLRGLEAGVRLQWDSAVGPDDGNGDLSYRLEEGADPAGWSTARTVYIGPDTCAVIFGSTGAARFFRVRAELGSLVSAWSNGVSIGPETGGAVVDDAAAFRLGPLMSIHRSMLRLCGSRQDMLGVLSMPEHYLAQDAIEHAERLRAAEPVAVRCGTLYHPWVVLGRTDGTADQRMEPPDGSVVAVLAKRAAARGAWVAPANEVLPDVIALARPAPDDLLAALQEAQVNELRQTPRGFLCLAQDTLADDSEVRGINVRRLLSLLRRIALAEGVHYVFEPNDLVLRRGIQRGFTELLSRLHQLGAFAGVSPDQAFRVDVGDPPNTPFSVDAGRLVIELKVAPSRPMAFLLVRLIRSGDGSLLMEAS